MIYYDIVQYNAEARVLLLSGASTSEVGMLLLLLLLLLIIIILIMPMLLITVITMMITHATFRWHDTTRHGTARHDMT